MLKIAGRLQSTDRSWLTKECSVSPLVTKKCPFFCNMLFGKHTLTSNFQSSVTSRFKAKSSKAFLYAKIFL